MQISPGTGSSFRRQYRSHRSQIQKKIFFKNKGNVDISRIINISRPGCQRILESRLFGYLKEQGLVLEKNIYQDYIEKQIKVGDMDISRNQGYIRKLKCNQDTKNELK